MSVGSAGDGPAGAGGVGRTGLGDAAADPAAEHGAVRAEGGGLQTGLEGQHLAVLGEQPGAVLDSGAEEGGQ